MKPRTTLLLAATTILLVVAFFVYERYAPPTDEAYTRASQLVPVNIQAVDGLTITNNEEKIELRLEDGTWKITAPVRDLADTALVVQILNTLSGTAKFDRLDPQDKKAPSPKEMGLTKSTLRLQLHGAGAPPEIIFGKDTVLEDRLYVGLEGDAAAYVINKDVKNLITKKPDDFREHRLLPIDPTYVRRVTINSPAGEIDAEKKDDEWQLKKPLSTAADGKRINELLSHLVTTPISSFLPENDPQAATMGELRGKVTIYPGSSGQPITLSIGATIGDSVLVKLDSRPGSVLGLPKTIEEWLSLRPSDVRNHALLRLLFDEVDRITISDLNGAKTVLGRREESWVLKNVGDRPANETAVRQLISNLQGQQIANFVDDVGSDLAKYGLDVPLRTVVFSSYASGNTAESAAGDHPLLTLLLGHAENGIVYAKTDEAPFVFAVNPQLLADLPADPVQWQEPSIFHYAPEQIVSVEITPPGLAPISLRRENGVWKNAGGNEPLDEKAVESLVNTLANLRAVRWSGSVVPKGVFSGPIWQYQFTVNGETPSQFTIGAETPEHFTYAMGKSVNGVFLLSKADAQSLQTPPVVLPSPTPVPTPTAP